MSTQTPTPADIAELLQVEHLLDQRWGKPESNRAPPASVR